MTYNYNHFTIGHKWSTDSVTYNLTDTSRAKTALDNANCTYDSSFGVKAAVGGDYNLATPIQQAFQRFSDVISFAASPSSNATAANITFSIAKDLKNEEGESTKGVKIGDPISGKISIIF